MLIRSVSLFDTRGWRWPHFSPRELACKCGGKFCDGAYWHDPDFLDALESLRAAVGRPLIVNSGHRCDRWNAEIGGAEHSMHRQIAVDLALNGHDRFAWQRRNRWALPALGLAGLFSISTGGPARPGGIIKGAARYGGHSRIGGERSWGRRLRPARHGDRPGGGLFRAASVTGA
jgi:hypothetical protein